MTITYVHVLTAAVQKDQATPLLAAAIGEAAADYAKNAGALPKLSAIVLACTTTGKGKARAVQPHTLPAVILAAVEDIKATAEAAGARPNSGATVDAREAARKAYAEGKRAAFVAAVAAAQTARAEAQKARKAEAAAKGTEAAASAGSSPAESGEGKGEGIAPEGTEARAEALAEASRLADALAAAVARAEAAETALTAMTARAEAAEARVAVLTTAAADALAAQSHAEAEARAHAEAVAAEALRAAHKGRRTRRIAEARGEALAA